MSTSTVEIKGKEYVSKAARDAAAALKLMGEESKGVFSGVVVTAGDVVRAVKAVAATVNEFITEYAEQERAILTFNAAMKTSTQLTSSSAASLREYAQAIALKTGADDEAVLSMEALLATSGRTEEEIKKIISAAADMSVVTEKDLRTSVEELNKTFSGSEGRLNTLIPALKDLTEEELKSGAAIDIVAKQYGVLSDELGGSMSVRIENFKNSLDDLKSSLAGAFSPSVNPYLKFVNEVVNRWTDAINEHTKYKAAIKKDVEERTLQDNETILKTKIAEAEKAADYKARQAAGNDKRRDAGSVYANALANDFNTKAAQVWKAELLVVQEALIKLTNQENEASEQALKLARESADADKVFAENLEKAMKEAAKLGSFKPRMENAQDSMDVKDYVMSGNGPTRMEDAQGFMDAIDYSPSTAYKSNYYGLSGTIPGAPAPVDTSFLDGLGSSILSVVSNMGQLGEVVMAIVAASGPIGLVILAATKIFEGLMQVLGPVVNEVLAPIFGMLNIFGQLIGTLLVPVIRILVPLMKAHAEMFVATYNALLPVFEFFSDTMNMMADTMNIAINWIMVGVWKMLDWIDEYINIGKGFGKKADDAEAATKIDPLRWFETQTLEKIDLDDILKAGDAPPPGGVPGGASGGSASYSAPRDITVNVVINTDALVGEGGIRDFSLMIGRELRSAGVLGMA